MQINKEILRLAVPNILSNISVPLISTVDTILMGHLSEDHLGAVGLGAMMFNFIYWNFGFLRMGSTGMTAQAYGRENKREMSEVLGRSLIVAGLLAVFILLLQSPLAEAAFYLLNVPADQYQLVADYFYIRVWAAPATLALYALFGWFFGMQNAIIPLVITVVINVLNIICSYYFVRVLHMEAAGVAQGTLIAQYAGLFLALSFLFWRYRWVLQELPKAALLHWQGLQRFLSINADIFLRTLCLSLSFGFFYSQSAASGDLVLAVNVILLQYLNWMSYGVDGFAFAAESLVGKYSGAQQKDRLQKAIRYSFVWGMGLALVYTLVYGIGNQWLLQLFTNQVDVIAAAQPFLWWMIIFPLLSTPCYIWDGIYIGLTAARAMRNTMLIAFIFYLGFYYLFGQQWGIHGLWLSLLLFMVMRGMLMWGWWKTTSRKGAVQFDS